MLHDLLHFLRLARPKQWSKGLFVLLGPLYALADHKGGLDWSAVLGAFLAFGFASSACYIVNDIRDRHADRVHPRKRNRPIASGAVSPKAALVFAGLLLVASAGAHLLIGSLEAMLWTAVATLAYVLNVMAYSMFTKHIIILDVIALAVGFVLRVLGGCAAAGVEPSTWLLNVTFFLAMFLSFGKRLGERTTLRLANVDAATARAVQSRYTEHLLRMAVVTAAVATLLTYAGYVQSRAEAFTVGFNLLWLTILPATYGLLRAIVLLEAGTYDDPTEMATNDPPFQLAAAGFALMTVVLIVYPPTLWTWL